MSGATWSGPATSPSRRRPWSWSPPTSRWPGWPAAWPAALVVVAPEEPVAGLSGRLAGGRTVAAVVAGGQLLGLITMDDLARASAHGGRARAVA